MYDIIIIGAGPSGMSEALYALRANKKVLLLEKECFGGQIINASNFFFICKSSFCKNNLFIIL